MSTGSFNPRHVAAADKLRLNLRVNKNRKTWMLSSTFWQQRFKVSRRTSSTVESISRLLSDRCLQVTADGDFGSEPLDSKIWIEITDVGAYPTDGWFREIRDTRLKTEKDVESFFILPLLQQLGYTPADIVTEEKIPVHQGSTKLTDIVADFVIQSPQTGRQLLVIEAKSTGVDLDKHEGQVRSYAYWLHTPAWVLTNGNEARLYHAEVARPPSMPLRFTRDDIESAWPAIITHLSRESIHHFAGQFWHPLDDVAVDSEEETP